jgi:hypothetical protein
MITALALLLAADFTGHWQVNTKLTKAPAITSASTMIYEVVHQEPALSYTRTDKTSGSRRHYAFRTDGVPTQSESNGVVYEHRARWQGQKLLVRTTTALAAWDDAWTLSPDGRRLTIRRTAARQRPHLYVFHRLTP